MILITTPSGDIGSRVLQNVLKDRQDVRVIARNPSSLPESLRHRVEVVEGSHADPDVIGRAISGVESVFWLPPGSPSSPSAEAAYVEFSRAFCDALPASSVTHVVGISALGRGWPKPAGLVTASLQMDDMIGRTGVNYRALTCASLMDNIQRQAELIQADGVFYQPTPARLKMPHVAKADVAAAAAGHLLALDWQGVGEVPLMGPEDISFEEMAEVMSSVLGRPVRYEEMPMEQFAGMMAAMGASDGMVRAYVDMLTAKNEGMDTARRPAARTGTPTTFRQWCEIELCPVVAA
ncbi:NmrA family transcriptional regulator [Tabrizicola piscis]|uniref:NmrA family transcriptional regulator n=1 Tax=Tabrizicola piscis TaxID=2494374 RepID=A0A3S8U790_9RHOB|nr:NAD(P)H-binding protein [Tabrizicola piscis]AZL59562.1 NmrA family transcriptional regulator [Tabrizicola piscis]